MQTVSIIKISGNILDTSEALESFLAHFSQLQGPKILVHGGGKIASQIGTRLGLEAHYHQGRRITDDATLDLVTMVYGGLINKQLCARLQALGCNAIGLSGADANLIPATRRAPKAGIDYGWAGDPNPADIPADLLLQLLGLGLTPVVAPLTHDGKGHLLNTNADTIAACLAIALANTRAVELVYCFEKKGILTHPDEENSVVQQLDMAGYHLLQEKSAVSEGILPKLDNAFRAAAAGVAVRIGHADQLFHLLGPAASAGTAILAPAVLATTSTL